MQKAGFLMMQLICSVNDAKKQHYWVQMCIVHKLNKIVDIMYISGIIKFQKQNRSGQMVTSSTRIKTLKTKKHSHEN